MSAFALPLYAVRIHRLLSGANSAALIAPNTISTPNLLLQIVSPVCLRHKSRSTQAYPFGPNSPGLWRAITMRSATRYTVALLSDVVDSLAVLVIRSIQGAAWRRTHHKGPFSPHSSRPP